MGSIGLTVARVTQEYQWQLPVVRVSLLLVALQSATSFDILPSTRMVSFPNLRLSPFLCWNCDFECDTKECLDRHIRSQHTVVEAHLAPTKGFDWAEELEMEELNNYVETREKLVETNPLSFKRSMAMK